MQTSMQEPKENTIFAYGPLRFGARLLSNHCVNRTFRLRLYSLPVYTHIHTQKCVYLGVGVVVVVVFGFSMYSLCPNVNVSQLSKNYNKKKNTLLFTGRL